MRSCHKEVASVAKAAAGEFYENCMSNNDLYRMWRSQNQGLPLKKLQQHFINTKWGLFIDFARATMAHMLGRPDIAEETKNQIYEALQLDKSLPVGRYDAYDAASMVGLVEKSMMN